MPTATTTARLDGALPRSPDISREVMGWLVISDADRLVQQLSPGMSPRGGAKVDPKQLQSMLLAQLGISPDLAEVIDFQKPLGLALLDPSLLASRSVQPFLAMVPVRSRRAVEELLVAHGAPLERTPWGFALPSGQAKMCFGFVGQYAVVAWRPELLQATVALLGPRLAQRSDAPVLVHLNFDNVHEVFGAQIETLLGQMARMSSAGSAGDPQVAYALRGLKQVAQYLRSVEDIELLVNLDSGGLTLTLRADGKENGALGGYIEQQRPGPAWGVQYLPRDSVLAYATHSSPVARAADLTASVEYLADLVPHRPSSDRQRLRKTLERAALSTGGEMAYAVWPGRAGGVGLGGAYRVNDAVEARRAVASVYETLSPQLGTMVMRALLFDPDKLARYVHVQKRTAHLGSLDADLIEVSVAWPKGSDAEHRLFESLFGKKLTLATAFVGDQALFAMGADYADRLATMIGTARGTPAASLGDEPAFVEALEYKQASRVSLSYLETAGMARFAAGLVQQAGELDDAEELAVARLLTQVGRGAIVSTTNAAGRRFEMTTHVPHSAIAGVAALNGALWRLALSPLVNPPMMPPMPVPPPHVAPSVNRAASAAGTL